MINLQQNLKLKLVLLDLCIQYKDLSQNYYQFKNALEFLEIKDLINHPGFGEQEKMELTLEINFIKQKQEDISSVMMRIREEQVKTISSFHSEYYVEFCADLKTTHQQITEYLPENIITSWDDTFIACLYDYKQELLNIIYSFIEKYDDYCMCCQLTTKTLHGSIMLNHYKKTSDLWEYCKRAVENEIAITPKLNLIIETKLAIYKKEEKTQITLEQELNIIHEETIKEYTSKILPHMQEKANVIATRVEQKIKNIMLQNIKITTKEVDSLRNMLNDVTNISIWETLSHLVKVEKLQDNETQLRQKLNEKQQQIIQNSQEINKKLKHIEKMLGKLKPKVAKITTNVEQQVVLPENLLDEAIHEVESFSMHTKEKEELTSELKNLTKKEKQTIDLIEILDKLMQKRKQIASYESSCKIEHHAEADTILETKEKELSNALKKIQPTKDYRTVGEFNELKEEMSDALRYIKQQRHLHKLIDNIRMTIKNKNKLAAERKNKKDTKSLLVSLNRKKLNISKKLTKRKLKTHINDEI